MNQKQIGKNIKDLRKEQHMTQGELAERANISTIHLSHIETGTVNMSLDTLLGLCNALTVTPNDILLGEYLSASVENMVFQERSNRLDYDDKLLLQKIYGFMEERRKK